MIVEILLSITGIVTGAAIGYCIFKLQNRDNFSFQLYGEYKQMAQELSSILESLLTLNMGAHKYTLDECKTIDKEISKFYFKYYLVLPPQVLEELSCMHGCLLCGGKYFYMVDKSGEHHKLRPCKTEQELNDLFKDVALTKPRIHNDYPRIPNYINLKCQARHVIIVMNKCWDRKYIHSWQRKISKTTIYQLEKK